jgi:uncharacterized membrane protein YphA (DoxX/SURF4 family)
VESTVESTPASAAGSELSPAATRPGFPRPPALPDPGLVRRYWYIRIAFGLVWAIDATLKWLPGFRAGYLDMVTSAAQGQPSWLSFWFDSWVRVIRPAPIAFAVVTAIAETALCASLLFGIAQRVSFVFGTMFAFCIWGVGEGFGGPYMNGSSDIGCAVMYVLMFATLVLAVPRAVRAAAPALDHRLVRRWSWFAPLTFCRGEAASQAEPLG